MSDDQYADIVHKQCLQTAVTFRAYEDLWDTLACMFLFSILTALRVFVKHQETPIVKANNWTLS